MPKIIIEYDGDFQIRENVHTNKIMSVGKVVADLGDSISYDLILSSNPKISVKVLGLENEITKEIESANLIISDNKEKEALINNIAALLQKSL